MDTWIRYSPNLDRGSLVFAGNDSDGSPMYVGRGNHSCDLIPGKQLTSSHRCHVSYNGSEISLDNSEVLMNSNYTWISCSDGRVPPNAVVGGRTSSGETLYVGRANHCGIVTPGKIHPSHQCLYLPFGWKEHRYTVYEALVRQQNNCCPPVQPPPTCPPVRPPCNCHNRPPNCPPCNCHPPVVCPPPIQPPVVCPPPVCPPPVQPPVCPPVRPPICIPIFRPCSPKHKHKKKHGHKRC